MSIHKCTYSGDSDTNYLQACYARGHLQILQDMDHQALGPTVPLPLQL